jgi:hypothetical protein
VEVACGGLSTCIGLANTAAANVERSPGRAIKNPNVTARTVWLGAQIRTFTGVSLPTNVTPTAIPLVTSGIVKVILP